MPWDTGYCLVLIIKLHGIPTRSKPDSNLPELDAQV